VAPYRSVVDLLAEQSEEALKRMRDDVRTELARLTVEADQIDQALARKNRRARTGGGRLTREQVLDLVTTARRPLTVAEVHERVTSGGVEVTLNAVRNHLTRLEEDGRLVRLPDNRFGRPFVPTRDPESIAPEPDSGEADDDDIPF